MTQNRMQKMKILLSVGADKLPPMVGAPASPPLNLCAVSFSVSEGADPFTMASFSNPNRRPDCSLHDLQLGGFLKDPARCPLLPLT
jgi:hypothetical protein